MSRWLVEIRFAKPPTYTCDVEAANEDAAIIRASIRAAQDGFFLLNVKHTKATLIEEDTTDDRGRTSEPAQPDDADQFGNRP